MTIEPANLAKFLESYWHKKVGLIATIFFIVCVEVAVLGLTGSLELSVIGVIVPVTGIIVALCWYFSNKIPRTKKGRVGFVISIYCDEDEVSKRVREDFVIPLRRMLKSSGSGSVLDFIEVPRHIAKEIFDFDSAERVRREARANFIIFGRVRERILGGNEYHVIELDGGVGHRPISIKNKEEFAKEFSELFPTRVNIDKRNDFLSFNFTSEWASIVAEYIIGIAASFSGDIDYAETLFKDAFQQLASKDKRFPVYAMLLERIPVRISELNEVRAIVVCKRWHASHDENLIVRLGDFLGRISVRPTSPGVYFLNAIYVFLSERDVKKSRNFLKNIKGASNGSASPNVVGTWNYNMAFLAAYEGKLGVATRHYKKAALIALEPDILTQVEDFLVWTVGEEPEKYQMYYCLGLFNWKSKGDLEQAQADFLKFLEARKEGEFVKEKDLVEQWMADLRERNN